MYAFSNLYQLAKAIHAVPATQASKDPFQL